MTTSSKAAIKLSFKNAFAGSSEIIIPGVLPEFTRATVLTTEWCEGRGFYEFEAQADQQAKNAAAIILVRFALRSLFGAGVINADPHPGNYLFAPDHRVVFLDFGCVRRFERPFLDAERRIVHVILEDNRKEFRDAVLATGMVPKEKGFDFDIHFQPESRGRRATWKEGVSCRTRLSPRAHRSNI